jgi:DNA-directed RNA polymerase sigma subunit (sigma70/sigma32)
MANEYLNNRTFESIIQSFQYHKRQKAKYELIIADLQETHDRRVLKYQDEEKKAPLQENEKYYQEACMNYKDFQEQLAYAFYILSENIANYAKFNGIDIDDAIQEGVLICFEKIDRFDPRKGKAFNYMTTCILNHFRQLYRSARNYNELKKRYQIFLQDKFESLVLRNGKERPSGKSTIDRDTSVW